MDVVFGFLLAFAVAAYFVGGALNASPDNKPEGFDWKATWLLKLLKNGAKPVD